MKQSWIIRLWESFSAVGLLAATLFFAASLTPSLVPRNFTTQGVLSGCSLAAGYGVGAFGLWIWTYLELPKPSTRAGRIVKLCAAIVFAVVAIAFLWRASEYQNSVRDLIGLERVDSAHLLRVGLIAMLVFAILTAVARAFQLTFRISSRRIAQFAPRPVSSLAGVLIAVLLFWSVVDGIFFRFALRAADASFQKFDELIEDDAVQPSDPNKTGSAASLLDWQGLGRAGREFIATGPTKEKLSAFLGREAQAPIRVYAGLNSAETPEERARLALEELKRVGGFERSALVIVTPTGTGWIDPAAMDSLEYLLFGQQRLGRAGSGSPDRFTPATQPATFRS